MKRTARLRTPADFGLALQQARLAHGLSQVEIAAQLDLPQSTISALENGKSTIHLRQLIALARATGVELNASWEDDRASGD